MPASDRDLEQLWKDGTPRGAPHSPDETAALPEAARRYIQHSIAPGTPRASAVRLSMKGTIKLRGWFPFEAEQVIRWGRGFVWRATTRVYGLPIRGADRWIDGEGSMRWKLLGLLPVVTGAGPDVSRSALGRFQIESIWLPSALLGGDGAWRERGANGFAVDVVMRGEHGEVEMTVDERGALRSVSMPRWGDPDGRGFRALPFGGVVEGERTFEGFTIPTRLRVGWHFGSDRFESEGEFFRCEIERATFR